jgi:predicted Fe-Mo cluster-binding NifX family protein
MKSQMIAIPVFQERISPLLDVAKKFALYEVADGEIKQKLIIDIHAECEPARIEKLKELGVSVIIGGAVSGFVAGLIYEKGINLIPWINGAVDDVMRLYLKDELHASLSENPACMKGRRRGRCGQKNRSIE